MNEKTISNNSIKGLEWGMHDAVVDGELVRDIPTRMIFVTNSTERDALENLAAGTFVAVYGLGTIWQRKADGTWATVKEA